jgi:hypothetical protein
MPSSQSTLLRRFRTTFAVGLTAAACAVVPAVASATPPVALSGAFVGWGASANLTSFGNWRGAADTSVSDYLNYDDWSSVADPSSLLSDWSSFNAAGGKLVLSVPMLVSDSSGTFAAGAEGAYDQYFLSMGRELVADGFGSTVLRLGWEFNGTWFPWSVQPGSATMGTAAFVAYYQHLVTLLRSIPGSNFTFDWTVNLGAGAFDPTDAWPGSSYVDYVGMDIYDRGWSASGGPLTDPVARWQQLTGQTDGMSYWASFAAQNGKQLGIGEWGLWNDTSQNGGGDDPYFIQQMYNWMQSNDVGYENYFDADNSVMNASTEPASAAEYQSLWGAPSGTTTSTSAPPTTTTTTTTTTPAPTTTTTTTAVSTAPPANFGTTTGSSNTTIPSNLPVLTSTPPTTVTPAQSSTTTKTRPTSKKQAPPAKKLAPATKTKAKSLALKHAREHRTHRHR